MMKTRVTIPLLILLGAWVLAACAAPGADLENPIVPPGQATPATPESVEPLEPTDTNEPVVPGEPEPEVNKPVPDIPVVGRAVADLADFLDVEPGEIAVTRVEEVTWSDASLGCPQPGTMYPQVLTDGYLIILTVAGVDYTYHADLKEQVIRCPDSQAGEQFVADPLDLDLNLKPLVEQAREDLAGRLRMLAADIEVVLAEAVVWPDAGLGCPQPGMKYKQVPQDGARIVLRVGGTLYTYHSGGGRAPFLCDQPLQLLKKTPGTDEIVPPPGFDE